MIAWLLPVMCTSPTACPTCRRAAAVQCARFVLTVGEVVSALPQTEWKNWPVFVNKHLRTATCTTDDYGGNPAYMACAKKYVFIRKHPVVVIVYQDSHLYDGLDDNTEAPSPTFTVPFDHLNHLYSRQPQDGHLYDGLDDDGGLLDDLDRMRQDPLLAEFMTLPKVCNSFCLFRRSN